MNKIIIIALLLSINVFGYRWTNYDVVGYVGGMCGEKGDLKVNLNSFSAYWQPVIKEILLSAISYWNEAGSEHILGYSDITGSDVYYTNSYSSTSDTLATCHTEVSVITWDCLNPGSAYIKINKKNWYDGSGDTEYLFANSYMMQVVLTHELGHYLGLAHTQDYDTYFYMDETTTPEYDYDDYPIMMNPSISSSTHLTEDDKYGVRSMYGKDDNSLQSMNSLNNVVTYYTTDNTAYQTYSKPQLTYQPSKNTTSRAYDYIMTWIKSNTRQINYRFVSECSNNTDICAATDMTSGNGMTLGEVHTITGSETLTSPSLAMKSDGSQAMIVWKQETENQQGYNSDDVYYALINGNEHSGSITGIKIHDNFVDFVQDYVAKSMFAPKVVWVDAWNRYVMFYTSLRDTKTKNLKR